MKMFSNVIEHKQVLNHLSSVHKNRGADYGGVFVPQRKSKERLGVLEEDRLFLVHTKVGLIVFSSLMIKKLDM